MFGSVDVASHQCGSTLDVGVGERPHISGCLIQAQYIFAEFSASVAVAPMAKNAAQALREVLSRSHREVGGFGVEAWREADNAHPVDQRVKPDRRVDADDHRRPVIQPGNVAGIPVPAVRQPIAASVHRVALEDQFSRWAYGANPLRHKTNELLVAPERRVQHELRVSLEL
jgi:hypothetical protein